LVINPPPMAVFSSSSSTLYFVRKHRYIHYTFLRQRILE
jgi:hypothetical protein